MCPIETPEGPNIGLITSLSTYASVNSLGFIETPYRVLEHNTVTDNVRWLSASEEEEFAVAQANAPLDEKGKFVNEVALCRKRDDYPMLPPSRIDYMDVAPEQLVSIAAALIPFLEHDDANRALMGSNMQRQAVPRRRCITCARFSRRHRAWARVWRGRWRRIRVRWSRHAGMAW